jgi:hypothetical protein
MCRLSRNSGASTSWNPQGPVQACSGKALPFTGHFNSHEYLTRYTSPCDVHVGKVSRLGVSRLSANSKIPFKLTLTNTLHVKSPFVELCRICCTALKYSCLRFKSPCCLPGTVSLSLHLRLDHYSVLSYICVPHGLLSHSVPTFSHRLEPELNFIT